MHFSMDIHKALMFCSVITWSGADPELLKELERFPRARLLLSKGKGWDEDSGTAKGATSH